MCVFCCVFPPHLSCISFISPVPRVQLLLCSPVFPSSFPSPVFLRLSPPAPPPLVSWLCIKVQSLALLFPLPIFCWSLFLILLITLFVCLPASGSSLFCNCCSACRAFHPIVVLMKRAVINNIKGIRSPTGVSKIRRIISGQEPKIPAQSHISKCWLVCKQWPLHGTGSLYLATLETPTHQISDIV